MNILIADDEPVARRLLREALEEIPGVEIAGEAESGAAAVELIERLRPDLLLVDYEMPGLDGLGVVRALRGAETPLVIFVTAYEQHAVGAFEAGAIDYVLKPVRQERLAASIRRARGRLDSMRRAPAASPAAPRKIAGKLGGDLYMLTPAEVIAFEADGELVHIITAGKKYLSQYSLREIESRLGPPFRRVHRKSIINTDHIRRISMLTSKRWLLQLSNGSEAIVSKRLTSSLRDELQW